MKFSTATLSASLARPASLLSGFFGLGGIVNQPDLKRAATALFKEKAHSMACISVLLAGCGGIGTDNAISTDDATRNAVAASFEISTPIALSDFESGDKPKIQRASDGTLVVVYGDAPDNTRLVDDVKGQVQRPARDIFVKTCKPDLALTPSKTCDFLADWSATTNISQSSNKSSMSSEWQGNLSPGLRPYPGDIDKPNIKTSGPVMVVTWVSKYCPDGDLTLAAVQTPVQRGVRYLERNSRIIPFSCAWVARSINNGATWAAPVQLSNGERDAIQDASSGSFNSDTKLGQVNISWQEDPQGLQLGEADGPGDGASGANVNGGTDVWYTSVAIDLSVAATPANDFVLAPSVRITDNWQGQFGLSGALNPIFDGSGTNVATTLIEKGVAGASRANIGMVGSTAIIAYEETKGSAGLDEGKFVRYHAFPFATPPVTVAGKAGCVISDPLKNARRVRFLTQSPTDAGAAGIQIAVFWKEGIYDKGGPADIMVRRGMGGLQTTSMVPSVDSACATSDYNTVIGLSNVSGENISSRASTLSVTDNGLTDGTEVNLTENALAHRGVLRGGDLWIGYTYTADLVKLWAGIENYNFWLRKYTFAAGTGSWDLPKNVSNISDKRINVREPRIFGTPKSNVTACPTGLPGDPSTTDSTQCQNTSVIYLVWGTQENSSPFLLDGGGDLGIYATASIDGAQTFFSPVRYSAATGRLFQDDESAYEAQVITRPDGGRFYGVWNQADAAVEVAPRVPKTVAEYGSGSIISILRP